VLELRLVLVHVAYVRDLLSILTGKAAIKLRNRLPLSQILLFIFPECKFAGGNVVYSDDSIFSAITESILDAI
jgi:hypothetical protein